MADPDICGQKRAGKLPGKLASVEVVLTMLGSHPYSNWPLHVKLFTEEAVKTWLALTKQASEQALIPKGLKVATELEGVDGMSGYVGSGRKGPIEVSDVAFTTSFLQKHDELVASQRPLACSVCHEMLHNYSKDSLKTTLCVTPGCSEVSHLACLSESFVSAEAHSIDNAGMIPRGGQCKGCQEYVLWGELVKGCYRREKGGPGGIPPEVEDDPEITQSGSSSDVDQVYTGTPRRGRGRPPGKAKASTKKPQLAVGSESGEFFDLDAVSSATEDGEGSRAIVSPPKRGRPRKVSAVARTLPVMPAKKTPGRPRKVVLTDAARPPEKAKASTRKPRLPSVPAGSESGEFFDLDAISSATDDSERPQATMGTPKKRGRPRKAPSTLPTPALKSPGRPRKVVQGGTPPLTMASVLSRLPPPSYLPALAGQKRPKAAAAGKPGRKGIQTIAAPGDQSGEFFDLNDISIGSSDDDDGVRSAPVRRATSREGPLSGPSSRPAQLTRPGAKEDKELATAMSTMSLQPAATWMDISD
ncbi:hypothetical protein HWV62_17156 [Athelia sp. TMB]|nr:hypothetical protein HWV62_17156 [Athelia sp. TMB]